eukprot:SAG11_NODE_976_length_6329_cov_6.100482_4_plen_93_part_00
MYRDSSRQAATETYGQRFLAGTGGRSDLRVHRSLDGGNSFELVTQVYSGSTSYSGVVTLNSTHVGVAYNGGSEHATSMTCGASTKWVVVCVR